MQETQVGSLGQEDPLEKEMATHFSILAWEISCTEKPGRLQSMRSQRVGQHWVTNIFIFLLIKTVRSLLLFSHSVCLTLCDPMDCSTPGFPVLHCLPEFAQVHIHWIGDAIQPSHPLSPPSPPTLNQDLFQWVGSSHQVAKALELQLRHQSFQGWAQS